MKKKHIVIVGAGPGGLCAGMLLSHCGFKVSIYDKNDAVGGRNRPILADGFTFDTGPTFLLMKGVLDEMFAHCNRDSADYLECVPLDPMYRLLFDDRSISVSSSAENMREELYRVFPETPFDFDRFLVEEERRFNRLYPCIKRDYLSLTSFLSPSLLKALPYLALNHSVFSNLGRYFPKEKMRLVFSFQSKYLGMSPWECPALFTMLSYLEHRYGIYHVTGGLNRIAAAMAQVITEQEGEIFTATPVKALNIDHKTVTGVTLEDGRKIAADEVIVNADFAYAMTRLVEPGVLKRYSPEKIKRKKFSCSTFMLYLGLSKNYAIPHHNIVFASDYKRNVENIFSRKILSDEFSFYVQNASATDPTLAPPGKSALYVLVPMPNNESDIDWSTCSGPIREQVLDALSQRLGLTDIREHIEYEQVLTPNDWQQQENVFLGATFNLSHRFDQMLYWRPRNRFEELERCYLVGGGTHPGSGLPTIYESARIAARLLCQKYRIDFPSIAESPWLNQA